MAMSVCDLIAGWFAVRNRVFQIPSEPIGDTSGLPVIAETSLIDEVP
jgi:hypothetical protein